MADLVPRVIVSHPLSSKKTSLCGKFDPDEPFCAAVHLPMLFYEVIYEVQNFPYVNGSWVFAMGDPTVS